MLDVRKCCIWHVNRFIVFTSANFFTNYEGLLYGLRYIVYYVSMI
jgi:hypothetical protein